MDLKFLNNPVVKKIKIGLFVAIPIILLVLPANFFDEGTSVCLSKSIFNIECLGCGMTRGIMHLIHLDFEEAWHFNKMSFIVFPILSIVWLRAFLQEFNVRILKWL